MTHVSLDAQDEALKHFVLGLTSIRAARCWS